MSLHTPHAISPFRFAFGLCAVGSAAGLAVVALVGYAADLPWLTTLVAGLPAMKVNAALAIIAAAGAWLALQSAARALQRFGFALAGLTALIAGVTLFEHFSGVDLGVDNVFVQGFAGSATGHPGRMNVATCLALLLAALALALTRSSSERAEDVRQLARLAGLAVPLFALALLVYDAEALTAIRGFEEIALNTALGLALLMLAIGFDRSTASLRWQVAQIGVVVVAPLAGLTVHFASSEREIALMEARARLAATARLVAERQDAVIEQARQTLNYVSRSPAVRGSDPACAQEMREFLPLNPWVRAIFTVDRTGAVRCADRPETMALNLADRDYVAAAFGGDRFTVSGFFLARSTNQPRIAVAAPIKAMDQSELLLVASLDLRSLADPLQRGAAETAFGTTMTLVDKAGVVIGRHPQASAPVGSNLADATFVTDGLSNPDRPFEAAELDGRSTLFVARRVLSGEGTLILGIPKAVVVGPVDVRLNRRLAMIAFILAASLGLGVLGSEALVLRPLRRLIAYAGRLEAGDLSARPDVRAEGEVDALGRALAGMAAAIEDRERRLGEAEALFRGLFDHSPDSKAVVRVEPNGVFRVETWNAAAAEATGLSAKDVIGRTPSEVFDGARGLSIEHDLRRVLTLERVMTVEREPTINGLPTVFEMVQVPLRGPDGAIERIFLSARDISERKRVERLKNEFVSTVSHELRTPLTSIAGSLGLLAGGAAGSLGDKAERLISIAHTNSLRLVRLINDILDIEKIEAGRMAFELKTLAVGELVEQAVGGLRAYADDFGVGVEVLDASSGLTVRGDADALTQVVTNLVSNAIKFSPRGGAVTVSMRAEGDIAVIGVRDRGAGIPESFRPRVFAKFAQADGSDSRRKGGTGLGLAIVKDIVERHAGAVSYRTAAGEGTEFEVRLPRQVAREAGFELAAAPPPPRPNVLICEDDLLIAAILSEQMRDAGFDSTTVATVRDALQAAEAGGVDAVLVDLNLPDGDGISLIRDLRAAPTMRRTPIVVISADAEHGRRDPRAAALDVAAWLEKPVDTERLSTLLGERLRAGGARPLVLHVEDDADLCNVVSAAVAPLADVVSVGSVKAAREKLEKAQFDLAIVDVGLEDGSGLDLLATLDRQKPRPVPAVIFSARDMDGATTARVEAAFTKSRTSLQSLVETVRRLIASRVEGGAASKPLAAPAVRGWPAE